MQHEQHGHVLVYATGPCSMDMEHAACSMLLQYAHAAWTAGTCSVDMQCVNAVRASNMGMQHGQAP